MIKKYIHFLKSLRDQNEEILYASIWRDTLRGIPWAESLPSISPGRFAVGYNYLYVITRILIDMKPKSILDVGLGISSTIISTYFNSLAEKGEHIIIEHDKKWADYYLQSHKLSDSSSVVFQELITRTLGNAVYDCYKKEGLDEAIKEKKFSVISIDAPIGRPKGKYARRDLLNYIPQILEKSFVIIVDDAGRRGEKNTIIEIEQILKNNGIKYSRSIYYGNSHVCVIASQDNVHFCSL